MSNWAVIGIFAAGFTLRSVMSFIAASWSRLDHKELAAHFEDMKRLANATEEIAGKTPQL